MSTVSVFDDSDDVRYMTGGERTEEYLWMDGIPKRLENRC